MTIRFGWDASSKSKTNAFSIHLTSVVPSNALVAVTVKVIVVILTVALLTAFFRYNI
ncbi:hypothetical protein SAMN04489740_0906 [Arthrobacter alpinus]|uniref:Uncharacterized protein n=1 Tax=Arthrobacter alpinus TaxID=656366 RepID=A0A1H5H1S2_9MICC|nr:hypothetical protein SAMN04489740_0906 [Arthrobacter alpinus]